METVIDKNILNSKIALKGYNRDELADKLGITPQSVTNIRTGKHNPSFGLINRMYRVLDLSENDAFKIFFAPNLPSE